MDYDGALDRAMEESPDIAEREERLTVPEAAAEEDGAFTRFRNLGDIADAVSREAEHIHRFVQQELGTSGTFEDGRGRYNGAFSDAEFDAAIDKYLDQYVRCSECGLPDTRLVREDRTEMLRCDACGAFRPVSKQRRSSDSDEAGEAIEEGETYEFDIVGTGRKGDGVAERGEFTIFVPGAQEGETVRARINNISGSLAFADRVE
jgi:translation initiation factor 2 subunit 2